jgi:hypothetical protein
MLVNVYLIVVRTVLEAFERLKRKILTGENSGKPLRNWGFVGANRGKPGHCPNALCGKGSN